MYLLSGPPFRALKDEPHKVKDREGDIVEICKGSIAALQDILTKPEFSDTKIGAASRTEYPKWSQQCLKLLKVPINNEWKNVSELIHVSEIYPGNKKSHFEKIKKETGLEYNQMVFFDNEMRNVKDVSKLGVTCFYTPNGMTIDDWNRMLKHFSLNE